MKGRAKHPPALRGGEGRAEHVIVLISHHRKGTSLMRKRLSPSTTIDPQAQIVCMMDTRRDGRQFFIDNLLARIHFIIEIIWWTGLAPWEFEFPFPGSLTGVTRE